MEKQRIDHLELLYENLEDRLKDCDDRITHMEPAVIQASNRNVAVYLSVVLTVINLLLLIIKG